MANNIISPVIFGNAVNEKLGINLLAKSLAFDATSLVPEILIAGNSVNLPVLNRVASVGLVTKGTAIVPSNVDMKDRLTPIKQAGTSIRVFDVEAVQIKGVVVDNMIEQCATGIAKFVDGDLISAMAADAKFITPLGTPTEVTNDELLTACSLFGDQRNISEFAGILCSSVMLNSFLKMPEFISVGITFNTERGKTNGLIVDNCAGYWLGVPVFVSDMVVDPTDGERIFVIKRNALGYFIQRDVKIELEREGKLLATDIIASTLFGTKLLEDDGVSVIGTIS
jgi:hypothetical protein